MMNDLDILETYTNIIKEHTSLVPDIAIILGSGLNSFANMVNIDAEISYSSLPDCYFRFPLAFCRLIFLPALTKCIKDVLL